MTLYGALFYLLGGITVLATVLAITRRNLVHAVVYLTISFFATAALFYLLGAPFLAALEVIIYAGAIMVLFLFIVMMLQLEGVRKGPAALLRQWLPGVLLGAVTLALTTMVLLTAPGGGPGLNAAMASPRQFGRVLFQQYWLPVEIASFLLLVALVGALYLGRREGPRS